MLSQLSSQSDDVCQVNSTPTVKKWSVRNLLSGLKQSHHISREFPHGTLPTGGPHSIMPYHLESRPDLPPSPVPAPPAFDKTIDGNRILLNFSLDPKDSEKNYTIRATLSLNSGPGTRFSSLTFTIWLTDGRILAISPETVDGPETEAEVNKDKSFQASLNTSLQAGSAPATASIGASTTFARAEHITFTRRTHGTIQGNGVGSTSAYWVMKEDNGPAAQRGLDSLFELAVKLNVRPANVSYEIVAGILNESGKKKTINSGILSTSV